MWDLTVFAYVGVSFVVAVGQLDFDVTVVAEI